MKRDMVRQSYSGIDIVSEALHFAPMEYGTYEATLAHIHRVEEHEGKAFRARIRVLRYEGVPAAPMPGKGSRIEYSFADLVEASLGLRMAEIGLPPTRIAMLIGRLRDDYPDWIERVTVLGSETGEDVFLCFFPNGPGPIFSSDDIFFHLDIGGRVLAYLRKEEGYFNLVINCTTLIRNCREALRATS
ncbi:hypothetical protein RUR49_12365 [Pseudoxanthobacter sp. M-2]|uniref:hypothetical protein n=1 Tax=Pseudoxanthobacter sp. M-2 TaxID=3078754 RepID=UPI0038FC4B06